jgi:integrase
MLRAAALRGEALSDLRVDDWEAHKDFLKSPDSSLVDEHFARHSPSRRPFAAAADGKASLSAASQRYTVRALPTAFAWWADGRYLASNPWKAVNDPVMVKRASAMSIERALPAPNGGAVRAAVLRMGDSGLRPDEAESVRRENLGLSIYGTLDVSIWRLTVIGKAQRERTVPVTAAIVGAVRAHWIDRAKDFDGATEKAIRRGRCWHQSRFHKLTHHVVVIE